MTVKITKAALNLREELADLRKPSGIAGEALLRADSVQEQRDLLQVGRKNLLLNGSFDIWQRGTSFTSSTSYHADRWTTNTSAETININKTVDGIQVNVITGGNYGGIIQRIEGLNKLRGKTVTVSYDIRGGQGSTGIVPPLFRHYLTENIAGSAVDIQYSEVLATISTTWQRISSTHTLTENSASTASDYLQLTLQQTTGATSGCDFEIRNVQLEFGSVATEFEHRSYGEELALCQRYYCQIESALNIYAATSNGNFPRINGAWPVTMRANPATTTTNSWTMLAKPTGYSGYYPSTSDQLFPTITADAEL